MCVFCGQVARVVSSQRCGEGICTETAGAGSSRRAATSARFGHSEKGGRTFLRNVGTIGTSLHDATARNTLKHFTARCHCPEHTKALHCTMPLPGTH